MIKYTCGAGTPEEAEANCTYFIRGECTASFCEYRRKRQTNADRIRSMSDEELAEIIACPKVLFDRMDCFDDSRDCEDCIYEWLRKPAGEEALC